MRMKKTYISDIKKCIRRFYRFEDLVKDWVKHGGGDLQVFTFLNLEGNESLKLPKHPYLTYNDEEKLVFKQCFGKPLVVPKDLNIRITLKEFLDEVAKRRDLMRECVSMTRHSRFRNPQYDDKRKSKKVKK